MEPRSIKPEDIEGYIGTETYFTAGAAAEALDLPLGQEAKLLTLCVIVLKNGFTVTGESACADPAKFDAEIGRTIAFRDALNKLYAKEGYVNRIAFLNREHFNSFAQELKTAGAEPIPAPGAEDDPLVD